MRSAIATKFFVYKSYLASLIPVRSTLINAVRNKGTVPKHLLTMEEAFIRYEKHSEVFDISFRYTNQELKVDRQFNFSRQVAESVNNFLKRVDTNVCKYVNKKLTRKKKKNTDTDCESESSAMPVDNVTSGKIMFLKDDIQVDGNTPCEYLLQNSTGLKLIIFEKTYMVKQNVPYISSISLPSSIMVGFPTYPSKFESLYTDKKRSIFNWYRNDAVHNKLNKWTHVGEGYLYVPSVADINCNLKIMCKPQNESDSGCIVEVESKNIVQPGPGECPFEIRHMFTNNKLSDRSFRIMSYNILANTYADSDYSKDVLFPYCPSYALEMHYRKQLILKEIIGFNNDIICLQEVDRDVYEHDLLPSLSMLDYDGVFVVKNEIREGLATFYNIKRFDKLGFTYSVMAQNTDLHTFSSVWSRIKNEKTRERFLARNTTIQVTTLRSKENPSEIFIIGNLHLYFKPDADHIRLLQGYYAITYMQEVTNKTRKENSDCNVSVILCGDFNSTPECGVYQLMTENYVPETSKDWESNPEEAVKNVSLVQDLCMSSACGTPEYTNYTPGFFGCLDYIYYEKDKFEVEQVIPMPSKEEVTLHAGLPSVVFPSDHISLCADLKLKTT